MLKARVQLLPDNHPAAQLVKLAQSSGTTTWLGDVSATQARTGQGSDIPDISETMTTVQLEVAKTNKLQRQANLRTYKKHHVQPALRAYDNAAFITASQASSWPYHDFQWIPETFPESIHHLRWGHGTWQLYRAWAMVKVTGKWPLTLFSAGDVRGTLDVCPLCYSQTGSQ